MSTLRPISDIGVGPSAFLFLLTSAVAPLIRLSYMKMVFMALPYTIIMSLTGYIAVVTLLAPATQTMYEMGLIEHHIDKVIQENSSEKPAH